MYKRQVFSLYDGDYAAPLLSAPPVIPGAVRMQLVTNPRVLGYTFNPVSFFLGYDAAGELVGVVAEVNNTYGGRHRYTLDDRHRTGPRTFRTDRTFFVSPFLHGPMHYDWKFDVPPGGPVAIEMLVVDRDTDERVLTARFTATRTPLSDRALALAALRYPFMTLRVIGLIYAEALVLHARRAKFARPDPATHAPVSTRW